MKNGNANATSKKRISVSASGNWSIKKPRTFVAPSGDTNEDVEYVEVLRTKVKRHPLPFSIR